MKKLTDELSDATYLVIMVALGGFLIGLIVGNLMQ